MRFRPPIAPLLGLAAAVSFAAAGSPAQAAGWLPGQPVSAPGDVAVTPTVALSPTGERFVAWLRLAQGSTSELGLAVRVAPANGDFGPVQLLPDADAEGLSLTTGSGGTAALVWMSDQSLHIATRAPGQGSFTEATPFPLGGFETGAPKVVMQGDDVYVTVGTRSENGNVETSAIHVLRLPARGTAIARVPGAGPGGTVAQVSFNDGPPSDEVAGSTIALSGGQLHVAWEDLLSSASTSAPSTTKVQRATGPTVGPLGAQITVDTATVMSSSADDVGPVIAAGGGRVDVVYTTPTGRIAYKDVRGPSGVQTVTPDGGGSNLHAAVDPSGALVLGWQARNGQDGSQGVFSAIVPSGGPPGPVVRLTPTNGSRTLDDFVLGPNGSALALPDRDATLTGNDASSQVQASFRSPGAAFGGLEEVSGPQDRTDREADFNPAAGAIGPAGQAIAAWAANDRSGTRNERIFISGRDAMPPAITGVSVPPRAPVQTRVPMSAAAVDSGSTATVRWDFGDGSQAGGAAVNHAYGQPGTYLVTVTALDAFGNSASQTRAIAITAPDTTDRTPPVISALSSAHPRFRVASANTVQIAARRKHRARSAAVGTIFSLRLSERATLVFSLAGKLAGRRATVTPPPFIRAPRGPGAVLIPFSGRVGGAPLAAGSYRMSVVAIDAAGNRSRTATVAFTVVSR